MVRSEKRRGLGSLLAVMLVFFVVGFYLEVRAETRVPEPPGSADAISPAQAAENPIRLGAVEGFTMDRVYIDGMDYALSKHIEYYSSKGEPVRQPWVKQGSRIKYVLGPDREVEVIQLDRSEDDE